MNVMELTVRFEARGVGGDLRRYLQLGRGLHIAICTGPLHCALSESFSTLVLTFSFLFLI